MATGVTKIVTMQILVSMMVLQSSAMELTTTVTAKLMRVSPIVFTRMAMGMVLETIHNGRTRVNQQKGMSFMEMTATIQIQPFIQVPLKHVMTSTTIAIRDRWFGWNILR